VVAFTRKRHEIAQMADVHFRLCPKPRVTAVLCGCRTIELVSAGLV
jgi:hypothetical protein